jgi:hypothetical protein
MMSAATSAGQGGFNAEFALFFGPFMIFVGWSAFRTARQTCDRITTILGAPTPSSGADRTRGCYLAFRIAGVIFIAIGALLFLAAAWQLFIAQVFGR